MAQDNRFKRAPAVARKLAEVDPQQDTNVRIFGTVVETGEDSVVIDDGTQAKEIYVGPEHIEQLAAKDTVRIFGRVLPSVDSFEIQGEIVQKMNDLNLSLYSQIKESYDIRI